MYQIEYVKPLPRSVRRITGEYFEILHEISPVINPLPIYVLPLEYLVYEHPECLGRFQWDYFTCHIELAGKQTDMEAYKDTICHEFAHYEQWRDSWIIGERGVAVRGRNLMRQVENRLELCV